MREETTRREPDASAIEGAPTLSRRNLLLGSSTLAAASAVGTITSVGGATPTQAQAAAGAPNIPFIMGDDIGWFNVGAYRRGMTSGKTPNLHKLAAEGMLFTDYYVEASCTAGRANFITGELPCAPG